MILTHRPLQKPWGQPVTEARRSRYTFKASWLDTLALLNHEIYRLDATSVVLQVDVTEADLRRDGQIRAHARPDFPGVRLIVDTPRGTLSWQTDVCEFWQHNVRSIALGLEALRAVDRYGITTAGEQYKGWLQLEAGQPSESPVEVLARIAGESPKLPESALLRRARAAAHPDRNDGDRSLWDQVEAAARTLGLAGS